MKGGKTTHIQIGATAPRVQYTANGSQTVFPYPFPIFQVSDLEVYLDDALQASGFSVSGAGISAGGNVTFSAAPAAAVVVTLRRRLAVSRTTDFQDNGLFRAKVVNDELDYQTAAIQQVADDVALALKRSPTAVGAVNLTVPEPAAGRALKWNATANGLINSTGDVDAIAAAAQASANAAAADRAVVAADKATVAADKATVAADKATVAADKATVAADKAAAATSAANAATSESNAAASAAKLSGTSATNLVIGTGSKVFTTQAEKFFDAGAWVLATSNADPANSMHGQVTDYSTTSLTVNVTNVGGSGTFADWTLRVSGTRGAVGATGPTGATGATGLQGPAGVGDMEAASYPTLTSLEGLSLVGGDILYATAADTLARLAKGTDGQVLSLASGVPAWVASASAQDTWVYNNLLLMGLRLEINSAITTGAMLDGEVWGFLTDELATKTNATYEGTGDYYTCEGSSSSIAQAAGTALGDMTTGGGLAAAFDGTTSQAAGAGATAYATVGYIGKDWGSGNTKTVSGVTFYGSNNLGLTQSGAGTFTYRVYGSNTSPANSTDGTLLYQSGTITDSASIVSQLSGFTTSTAYRYHWVRFDTTASSAEQYLSEVTFFETNAATDMSYWLHRVRYLQHDPASADDEATQLCRQVAEFVREFHMPAVRLETNGIGRFLPGLLRRELTRMAVPCGVIEAVSTRSKDARIIEGFDAVLAAGALYAHRSVWSTPFITEMREWRPGVGGGRDDGLDAVSGCLLAEPVRLPRGTGPTARPDWRPGSTGWKARTDFTL